MQEVRATSAKHWTERVWYCHNQRWMRSSKAGIEASTSGSFKNGQEWGKERRTTAGDNRPHSERRVPWTKGGGHSRAQCVHPGVATRSQCAWKADRHMRLLTIETENRLGTLWDQEQCNQFCSKEELWEAVRDAEMKMEEQYQERFWRQRLERLDGIGLDTATKEFLAIEFRRTQEATTWRGQQRLLRSSTRVC